MYQKTILPNHIGVVSNTMKERDSVSVGLAVATGGRYEQDKNKGAAHFLEHILFKGSKSYTCDQIKELIEGVGGSLNAFTSEEMTCYFAKIPAKHLDRTLDILSDMVFYPLIANKDVEKERTVILEEIKMYHDLPQYFVLELLDELIWPDHPLGKNLAGTVESISAMTTQDLKSFHRQNYFPANIVVAGCGQLQHQKLIDLIKKKVNQDSRQGRMGFLKVEHDQAKPKARLFKKEIEQMHLALGMYGVSNNNPDRYAVSLLNIILGGNMSSRLFDEVREKRGLAYSISSSHKSLNDTGMLLIRAGVDNKKIVQATEVILKELKKIKSGVTQDEFTRAKDYLLGQILLGLEDTLEHMLWIQESMITWDRVRTLGEIVQQVEKVTIEDIRRVARDLFREDRYNLAVVGPLEKKQEKTLQKLLSVS